MEALGLLAIMTLTGLIFIYSALSWGLVFFKFYGWFVLPVYTSLPDVNYWQSVGLIFFVGLFCRYHGEGLKNEYKDFSALVMTGVLTPWWSLFLGYMAYLFFI